MKYRLTPAVLFALGAALCVLLAAWFVPLPRIIAGEEELATKRLPETRANVMSTQQAFKQAQERYQTYIKTHDVGAAREQAIASYKGPELAATRLMDVIYGYADELLLYAQASDKYFSALHAYDDDLMSWTRSLGASSESLRSATFPFVEHLKRYPPPVGLTADPPDVKAATLQAQIEALHRDTEPADLAQDIDNIWASGRSIEYVAGLHDEYYQDLQTYDGKVATVANAANQPQQSSTRRLVANSFNVLLGAVVFGGLAALFVARKRTQV